MTDSLDVERLRDLRGRRPEVWVRRALLALFAVVPVLALLNVFGQTASDASVSTPTARLVVHSPTHARGGLLYEAKFTVVVHQQLKQATLSLSRGWADGLTINTIEPSPSQESSAHGELTFEFGQLDPGQTLVLHMQFQVNPTAVGSRDQQVELLDGSTLVASIHRHLMVWP